MSEAVKLFDANCAVGRWGTHQPQAYVTANGLLEEMAYCDIQQALVYHTLAWLHEPARGNEDLLLEVDGRPGIFPCWILLPPYTGEMAPPHQLVDDMRSAGVRAGRIFPRRIGPLQEFVFGELFEALAAHRIPLFVDFELHHYSMQINEIDWTGLQWMLGTFPDLPVILPRLGQAVDRLLLPLVRRYPNLYVEICYYVGHGALARMVETVGAERLVFGTGMPVYAPGPAITLLMYSGLDAAAQQMIGAGNLQRLVSWQGGD